MGIDLEMRKATWMFDQRVFFQNVIENSIFAHCSNVQLKITLGYSTLSGIHERKLSGVLGPFNNEEP